VTDCSIAPVTESPAPVNSAIKMRGSLISQMIWWLIGSILHLLMSIDELQINKLLKISLIAMSTLPILVAARIENSSTIIAATEKTTKWDERPFI